MYEPKVGDMVQVVRPCAGRWNERQRADIDACHPVGSTRTLTLVKHDHVFEPVVESAHDRVLPLSMVAPLRPTRAGQRVRCGEYVGTTRQPFGLGFHVMFDGFCMAQHLDTSRLVVVADEPKIVGPAVVTHDPADTERVEREACPACGGAASHAPECTEVGHHASEEADSWTPPKCGRAGHDPECMCATGWVREAEPEPSVREVWTQNMNGQRRIVFRPRAGAERGYVAEGFDAAGEWVTTPAGIPYPTRDGAIAAWRARLHG